MPIYGTTFPHVERTLSRPTPGSDLSRPQVYSSTLLIDLQGEERESTRGRPKEAVLRELAALDIARTRLEQTDVREIVAIDLQRARLVKAAAFYGSIETVNLESAGLQEKDSRTLRVRDPWG